MYAFLVVLYVLCSLFLIMVVLLQQGKGSGMGAAFGGASNTLFGGRGQTTPLQKLTTISAVLFMTLSIGLTIFSTGASSDLADEEPLPAGQEEGLLPEQPADPMGMTPAAPVPVEAPSPDAKPVEPATDAPEPAADAPKPADAPAANP